MSKKNSRGALLRTPAIVGTLYLALAGQAAYAQGGIYTFDIPSEPLTSALQDVAKISGKQIFFAESLTAGKTSLSLHGDFTTEEALTRLLDGSDLVAVQTNSGGIMVRSKNARAAIDNGPINLATETVTVTGSRVISDAANSPTPLTVLSSDQLKSTTPTNVADGLMKLPVFLGSNTTHFINTGGNRDDAGNQLNLRDFGTQRTLVLLDGHRVALTTFDGTVDINTLPLALMERVDVVTGGASSVYGSDAVTGVVNFILDKNFNGVKYDLNAGISTFGDAASYQASAAAGTGLFGGRGHLEGSLRYFHQDSIPIAARPYAFDGKAYVTSGAGTAQNPYVLTPYARLNNQSAGGLVSCVGCAANHMQFIQNGVIGPFNPGTSTGTPSISNGGDGGYDPYSTYQAELRMAESFVRFSYDLTDNVTASIQGSASESYNYWTYIPVLLSKSFFTNNAYLTPAAQTSLANPSDIFTLSSTINGVDNASAGAQKDVSAFGIGNRALSLTADVGGTTWNRFNWDLYYTHGESRQKSTTFDNPNNQKIAAASDAVLNSSGNPVCYVSTTPYANLYPGCVPLNPFGPGSVTAAQYKYINDNNYFILTNILDDVGGSVSGSIVELPAGPVKAALSAEARWVKYDVASDANPTATVNCTGLRLCNSSTILYQQPTAAAVTASNNVYEFAAETNIPLLKDVPLIQSFNVDLAGRFTNYSTSGSAETWKIGFDHHVNDTLRFRGTMSVDIRAPTLVDLFAPERDQLLGLTDLLTGVTDNTVIRYVSNAGLKPEVAHTYTVGAVLTPDVIPGLTFSIDYYNINLSHGITTFTYSNYAFQQACVSSAPKYDSVYCALANRPIAVGQPGYTSPANFPPSIFSKSVNSAAIRTEGLDLEASYHFDLVDVLNDLPGSVNLRALGTYQPYITTIAYPGAAPTWTQIPKGRVTAFLEYQVGTWTFNFENRWMSSYDKRATPTQVYDPSRVAAYDTLDITVDKKFGIGDATTDVYFSVQNVANTMYPLTTTNMVNPGQFYPGHRSFGDSVGRYFTIGLRGNL